MVVVRQDLLSLSLSLREMCLALHPSSEVSGVRSIPTCQMSPVSPPLVGSCPARGRRRTNGRGGERLVVAGPGRQEVSSGVMESGEALHTSQHLVTSISMSVCYSDLP